jgi:ATP-binding cassette, subfamily C (CFTR/MRP), member 1
MKICRYIDVFTFPLPLVVLIFILLRRETQNPSAAALQLTYIIILQWSLIFTGRYYSTIIRDVNSSQRILHYCNEIEQENDKPDQVEIDTRKIQGEIEFNSVDMAYRPGLPKVLLNVSFKIEPREKIGIVGRSGSGKTSLTMV